MQNIHKNARILACSLILSATALPGEVNLQVRDGLPIVDSVYVNGHGPCRFLLDTGANVNLIDAELARSIGLVASFRTELASATGVTVLQGSDGIGVLLGPARADSQPFVFSALEGMRRRWPDLQGVLGQSFLSQFDYTLDLRDKRLELGKRDQTDPKGIRVPLRMINGRLAVATNLGNLILDSGTDRLILFGVKPEGLGVTGELRSYTGSQQIGTAFDKSLTIGDRKIWHGDVVAIPNRPEPGVDGLLPLKFFKTVYVCNSEGYAVLE